MGRLFIYVLIFASAAATAHSSDPKPNIRGRCENYLARFAIEQTIASGDIEVGPVREIETVLKRGNVGAHHIANIIQILKAVGAGAVDSEPLRDLLQFLAKPEFRETTLVCVAQKNCKARGAEGAAAFFVRFGHQGGLSVVNFHDLPPLGSQDWMELEAVGQEMGMKYNDHNAPKVIVVQPFRPQSQEAKEDPLHKILTFEGEFLHELLHAADMEILKMWINASLILAEAHEKPDDLFKKFTRISPLTGRVFLSSEFTTLFKESRAYDLTYHVRQMFEPQIPAGYRDIALFTAWLSVGAGSSQYFNIMDLAGLPNAEELAQPAKVSEIISENAARMKEINSGPNSWCQQMKATIQRAIEIKNKSKS